MTQTRFTRPALILAAAAATMAGLPAAAQTERNTIETQETVRFNRGDLATPAGIASLHARIARAARVACSPSGSTFAELAHQRTCIDRAVAEGNARIETMLAGRAPDPLDAPLAVGH